MTEDILPIETCRKLLLPDASVTDEELLAVRQNVLDLAEIITAVYSAFKSEVADFDPEEIRAAGHWGMVKLTGFDIGAEDIDEILNGEPMGVDGMDEQQATDLEEDLSEGTGDE